MLILCHRGYHADAPENTIDAFEAAMDLGVDGVETDVQLCADGVPILFHERLSPDGRSVENLSRHELSSLVGYKVPTLIEALKLLGKSPRNFLWNFEIKNPNVANQTVSAIASYTRSANILVSSFWHNVIDEISSNTELNCAVILAHSPLRFNSRPSWIPFRQNAETIVWFFDRSDPDMFTQSRRLGLRNLVYGPVTYADHEQLAKWDVDGIITDYPNLVRPVE